MPLTYNTPPVVTPAITAAKTVCVGVNIRMPREGTHTITYYFEDLDVTGAVVAKWNIDVPLADIKAVKPAKFNTVFGEIQADAYERAQAKRGAGVVTNG